MPDANGKMLFLNLGCGNRILASDAARLFINHDRIKHRAEIDVTHDLNVLPWPWGNETFDHVLAWSCLEHLTIDLLESIGEVWRILRVGGEADVKLPYWNSEQAHDDPTHRWFCTVRTFDQCDPRTQRGQAYAYYTPYKFRVLSATMNQGKSSINFKLQKIPAGG